LVLNMGYHVQVVANLGYVADGTAGLLTIYDVTNNNFLGGCVIPGGQASGLQVIGKYAYVAAQGAGLQIIDVSNFDVSDPPNPKIITKLVGSYSTASSNAYRVEVVGNLAYVADGTNGVQILDISNKTAPKLLGSYSTGYGGGVVAKSVQVVGNWAYVPSGTAGLLIFNVSNPSAPTLAGTAPTLAGGSANSVQVIGNFAFVTNEGSGLQVINVSNPTAPTLVGSYDTPGKARGIEIIGKYAYIADGTSLQVFDISVLPPSLVGNFPNGTSSDVEVEGNVAYYTAESGSVEQVEVLSPVTFQSAVTTPGDAYRIQIVGNKAYVAAWTAGLLIYNVDSAGNLTGAPTTVANLSGGGARGVQVVGNYAYVADWAAGLQIIDLTTATPTTVGSVPNPSGSGKAYRVEVAGNLAYVSSGADGLVIVDVSDPTAPQQIGQYNTPGITKTTQVVGNLAYIADDTFGLQIVDVSNPFNPQLKGVYNTPGNANSIKVIGNLVFVTDEGQGLQILNVSDPTTPTLVGSYDTAGTARGIDIVGNYAYIGDGTALQVLDISNPAAPNLVATYNTTGAATARGVDVQGLLAYVAETDSSNAANRKVEVIDVSAFDNIVTLTSAKDTINAQSGDDILSGDFSTIQQGDSLNGGSLGIDTLTISGGVAANAVTITAASTTNQLAISNPVLTAANVPVVNGFERFDFSGFAGNVTYTGTSGYDWVQSGSGNDSLNGGVGGADTLIGGAGNDTYFVDNLGDFVVENAGGGTADIIQSSLTYSLVDLQNVENLTLTGSGIINGTGNSGNNVLTGNSVNNVLTGGDGNDTLNGGVGADTLIGGAGNDTYFVDNLGDFVVENAGGGTADTIQSSLTYSLVGLANVENLTLTGSGIINGTGNSGNNFLTGNSGNNVLSGGAGNDTLNGGAGIDTLIGGTGNDIYVVDTITDVITENAGQGTDTIQSSVTFSLAALPNIENLTLTGATAINGTGNSGNNVLTGNTGNNTLTGGGGSDTFNGGAGADILTGSAGGVNTYVFQFGQSSVSVTDRITNFNFAPNTDKIDLLTSAAAATGAPTSFSRAADFTATATSTLTNVVNSVVLDADGTGSPTTGFAANSAALVNVTGGSIAGTYLLVNDPTAAFSATTDLIINITGYSGTLPGVSTGSAGLTVSSVFA
jgi:hypothetical protein